MKYSFCPKCGHPLEERRVDGHERLVCSSAGCGFIFYQNPKPCASALVLNEQNELLLVQRAVEPFKDYWDIPGGFLEAGESPEAGARRELAEETGLQIELTGLLGIFMDTYDTTGESTLNVCYTATVSGGEARPDSDVKQLAWFPLEALPGEIAFAWSMEAIRMLQKRVAAG